MLIETRKIITLETGGEIQTLWEILAIANQDDEKMPTEHKDMIEELLVFLKD